MVSEKLLTALNDQFNFELESAYVYMAMAAYCSDEDYDGFSHFFHYAGSRRISTCYEIL